MTMVRIFYGRMLGTIWLDGYDINASWWTVDMRVYRFEDNAIVPAISNMNPQHKGGKRVMGRHQPCPTMAVETGKRKAQKGERRNNHDERASSVTSVGTKRFRSSNHACLL